MDQIEEGTVEAIVKGFATLLFTVVFAFAYCSSYENFTPLNETKKIDDDTDLSKKKKKK